MVAIFSASSVSKVKPANYYLWFRKRSGPRDGAECVPIRKFIEKAKILLRFSKSAKRYVSMETVVQATRLRTW